MSEEKNYPSLLKQGKNLAEFSFELIKNAIQTGALQVSEEIKSKEPKVRIAENTAAKLEQQQAIIDKAKEESK